jgi:hypothetical protein
MLELYDLADFRPPTEYTLLIDSSRLTREYEHRPCHLLLATEDLRLLQQNPGGFPLVYINLHKNVNYLSTLIAIAKVHHLPLYVYTTHPEYWSDLIRISGLYPRTRV